MTFEPGDRSLELRDALTPVIQQTFLTLLGLQVRIEAPLTGRGERLVDSVSGLVGLSGELQGSLGLHGSISLASWLTRELLGENPADPTGALLDTWGELVNLVAGGFKGAIGTAGGQIDFSLPMAIAGSDYAVTGRPDAQRLLLPVGIDRHQLVCELEYLI